MKIQMKSMFVAKIVVTSLFGVFLGVGESRANQCPPGQIFSTVLGICVPGSAAIDMSYLSLRVASIPTIAEIEAGAQYGSIQPDSDQTLDLAFRGDRVHGITNPQNVPSGQTSTSGCTSGDKNLCRYTDYANMVVFVRLKRSVDAQKFDKNAALAREFIKNYTAARISNAAASGWIHLRCQQQVTSLGSWMREVYAELRGNGGISYTCDLLATEVRN
jgi:hypothetical protein